MSAVASVRGGSSDVRGSTNIRNVNWVVFYWKFPEYCPCALNGNFGANRRGLYTGARDQGGAGTRRGGGRAVGGGQRAAGGGDAVSV